MYEADCFAQPQQSLSFGQWRGGQPPSQSIAGSATASLILIRWFLFWAFTEDNIQCECDSMLSQHSLYLPWYTPTKSSLDISCLAVVTWIILASVSTTYVFCNRVMLFVAEKSHSWCCLSLPVRTEEVADCRTWKYRWLCWHWCVCWVTSQYDAELVSV